MRRMAVLVILTIAVFISAFIAAGGGTTVLQRGGNAPTLELPEPQTDGGISVESALKERRSIRFFEEEPITIDEVGQLLWAVQGITDDSGHRTAPSAWEAYPLEVYVLAGDVTDLQAGVYHYVPEGHMLERLARGDMRDAFIGSTIDPSNYWCRPAPALFVITMVPERSTERGIDESFVFVEAGLAAENFLLQVVSLGLGSTYVGGFYAEEVQQFLNLEEGETPIAVLPVGRPA